MNSTIQYILYLTVLTALAIPLGGYIARAMTGRPVLLSRVLRPCEDGIYRALNIDPCEEMGWKKYLLSAWRSWRGFMPDVLLCILASESGGSGRQQADRPHGGQPVSLSGMGTSSSSGTA